MTWFIQIKLMLILNLKAEKRSEYTALLTYHLNSDTNYSQCLVYLKKIGNYLQTFYVMTKYNGKNENRDNITT